MWSSLSFITSTLTSYESISPPHYTILIFYNTDQYLYNVGIFYIQIFKVFQGNIENNHDYHDHSDAATSDNTLNILGVDQLTKNF